MASRSYSFIDVAVLDAVRARICAGEALLILSAGLDEIIWANGPGARLLGFSGFAAAAGADPGLPHAALRQIRATTGYPGIRPERQVAVRLAAGLASRLAVFTAGSVTLPDGEEVVLLALPEAEAESLSEAERARRAISGLAGEGRFVAMVAEGGRVAAASPGFEGARIEAATLAALVEEVRGEADRLVKRMVPAGGREMAAGIARLSDEPALHLVVIVDGAAAGADEPAAPHDPAEPPAATPSGEAGPPAAAEDRWYFNGHAKARVRDEAAAPAAPTAEERERTTGEANAQAVDLSSAPVRFVWRTDAQGRFTIIGEEFRQAVGEAADIEGRSFGEVADALELDPGGEIAGLLERRDTWSGRTVLWPVAGTDLRVPVDLAALPAHDRDRTFEGFRGFGVARMGDAVVDPEATGLGMGNAPREADPPREAAEDPFQGEVPALEIVQGPERRHSDKVIRLAERRPTVPEKALSSTERLNFQEIGERLRNSGIVAPREDDAPLPIAEALERDETEAFAPADMADPVREPAAGLQYEGKAGETALPDENLPMAVQPSGLPPEAKAETEAVDEEAAADAESAGTEEQPGAESVSVGEAALAALGIEDAAGDKTSPSENSVLAADGEGSHAEGSPQKEGQPDEGESEAEAVESAGGAADERSATPQGDEAPPRALEAFVPSAFAGSGPLPGVDTALLSRLPVPLLIHSGDTLHYANRDFLHITGYRSLAELEAAGGLGAIFADPYENREAADRKLRLRVRSGEEFPVDAHLQSVDWNGGKALLLALKRPDARKAAPAGIEARAAELRTIIDTATDGVVLIGEDGAIRSISRPAEALFGLDSPEVAGRPFETLFAIESQKAARDYLEGLSEGGVASVLNDGREVIGREAQGRFIPLFMTIGRLPEGGHCAVLRDITQWKRAEEELTQARSQAERASSLKTDFLARVSHEIRTPLNAIIGFSELMIDEKFGPISNDRYRGYLRDINKSGNHVLDLVNDLLDISKIEAGEQEMSYEAVSLNDTLGETVAMMQPQANRERVIIRSSFASRLPEVVADLRSVRQIALNLLSNAIRYTQAGGQVIVSTSYEPSGDIVMRVRDTGVGMSPAEIEQALKPFRQVNALKRKRGDGTGLGLPLTKAMVEANRAHFAIHSTPGEGTLVEIVFPSTRVLAH